MSEFGTLPPTQRRSIFLPLRAVRGRYRGASDNIGLSTDPRTQHALRTLLWRSSERVSGIAEIAGRLYQTLLYIPRNDKATAYVETDEEGVPVDAPKAPPMLTMFATYVETL